MKFTIRSLFINTTLCFGVFTSFTANAGYTVINLAKDYGFQFDNGFFSSEAYGINNSGQVIGAKMAPMGQNSLVVWSTTDIQHPKLVASGFGGDKYSTGSAREISNAGMVPYFKYGYGTDAGVYDVAYTTKYSFLGSYDPFSPTGATPYPSGVNDNGHVVGTIEIRDPSKGTVSKASRWCLIGGVYKSKALKTPLGVNSFANDINNAGQIVGSVNNLAALWHGNNVTNLGALAGYNRSAGVAINNAGQTVGTSSGIYTHATLWNGNQIIDLGTLGGNSSGAVAINASGDSVGWSLISSTSNESHATLWKDGGVIDLNTLLNKSPTAETWLLIAAYGINDSGWIVGSGFLNGGTQKTAFLLIPDDI